MTNNTVNNTIYNACKHRHHMWACVKHIGSDILKCVFDFGYKSHSLVSHNCFEHPDLMQNVEFSEFP